MVVNVFILKYSVTTGDSRKGCLGAIFVFSMYMYVCIFGGVEVEC